MHPFSTPWKHQKTLRFFDVFQGVEKGCIGNEWVKYGFLRVKKETAEWPVEKESQERQGNL